MKGRGIRTALLSLQESKNDYTWVVVLQDGVEKVEVLASESPHPGGG